jgi:hypothetical protein
MPTTINVTLSETTSVTSINVILATDKAAITYTNGRQASLTINSNEAAVTAFMDYIRGLLNDND